MLTKSPAIEQIVYILQGGGALGAYQAGVFQALQENNYEPNWIIGNSIGAINASIKQSTIKEHLAEGHRDGMNALRSSPWKKPISNGESLIVHEVWCQNSQRPMQTETITE